MLGASVITTQLRYKEAWLHGVITAPFAQLATLGLLMALVVAIIVYTHGATNRALTSIPP